ncbi:MAG: F0F1 ATP synthase subunit A [Candidatus Sulfopaludibacter sp.]|nr:F0F1 ATP synthase subunit A [Candidatus Sulfopaludibacter sp.]
MHGTELWLTKLFNDHLASLGNFFLGLVHMPPEARPWVNHITMQVLVAFLIIVIFALLRPRLSADRPGKFQHTLELIYDFVRGQADEQVGHEAHRYLAFFGTIFIFVLCMNLIGVVPGFESPTMSAPVPLGCALATFCYYNVVGVQANGIFKYMGHFVGPIPAMAPLMIPIEIVSHLARPLSLTLRLFANMYAGEQVTMTFLSLTYFVVPAIFMGLHVFVALLQAYIFMLLTMLYVAGSTAHEH